MIAPRTLLFLAGGEGGAAACAEEFVQAAGGAQGNVALLLQGGPNTMRYTPRYINPLLASGLGAWVLAAPGDDGMLDEAAALRAIGEATAIYVGGGNTPVYHRLYTQGRVGALLRERLLGGLPYAGLSAGMLIAGALCPLYAEETGAAEMRLAPGLGLFDGVLCEPHFTAQGRLPELLSALQMAGLPLGCGVDDDACLVLCPREEPRALGGQVHYIPADRILAVQTLSGPTAAAPGER